MSRKYLHIEVIAKREDVNDQRLIHCKVKNIFENEITKDFKWRDAFYRNFTIDDLNEYLVELCRDLKHDFNVTNCNIDIRGLNWDRTNTITKADVIIQYDLIER